ncbi:hypothetical protein ACVWZT_003759 [Pseudomonas sp. TE21394]
MPREHRRSRCHPLRRLLRGTRPLPQVLRCFELSLHLREQLSCSNVQSWRYSCGSGLVPRTPAQPVPSTASPASRHKAAPTGTALLHVNTTPAGATVLLKYSKLALFLWERACPGNTGAAGAILRVACFAAQGRSHRYCAASSCHYTSGSNCLAQMFKAGVIPVGAGLPREHRRSRCHPPRRLLRGTRPLPQVLRCFELSLHLREQLSCSNVQSWRYSCGSGLAPRTPAKPVPSTASPASRHKAAPTGTALLRVVTTPAGATVLLQCSKLALFP